MKDRLAMFAERRMHENTIGLYIVAIDRQRIVTAEATQIVMQNTEDGMMLREPQLRLTPEEATALAEELWLAGIRPRYASENAGALAATERHLKDMQRLVFDDKAP